MSTNYRSGDEAYPHFLTLTLVEWVDLFSRKRYKDILLESLRFYTQHQRFRLHAWVIMTNHVHLIASAVPGQKLVEAIRTLKRFTAKAMYESLQEDQQESRKNWMNWIFRAQGKRSSSNEHYKVWIHENHPIELSTPVLLKQRLDYLHQNPVRAGICYRAEDYIYSSAGAYAGEQTQLPLVLLE
ncbi:REP-associated tyrosine transposase [Cesiribacter andamanensis]|uniref:Transposase n=1 Tax=Cesiribacter andamanensis AMV16 TaxID=1279009 RepID=M7P0T4_9BACT|nr:transposase [Cesiribacter andamanensis]EMR04199.1 Transposase [Cesiribacter andamanensis AMV16]